MRKQKIKKIALLLGIGLLLLSFSACITLPDLPESTFDSTEPTQEQPTVTATPIETQPSPPTEETTLPTEPTEPIITESTATTPQETTEGTASTTTQATEPSETLPDTEDQTTATEPEGERIKIYIDQGHNPSGVNTGAQGNGLREENVTYAVGIALAELLLEDPRFEVRLSRPTPETVLGSTNTESLKARTDDANAWGADYFISIHANSYTDPAVHGIEAFAFSNTGEAFSLGSEIVDALAEATDFSIRGMKTRTDLYVLKNTAMPAVLVEIGFITNPDEAALMGSSPEVFAQGIYNGIAAYFQS